MVNLEVFMVVIFMKIASNSRVSFRFSLTTKVRIANFCNVNEAQYKRVRFIGNFSKSLRVDLEGSGSDVTSLSGTQLYYLTPTLMATSLCSFSSSNPNSPSADAFPALTA